MTNHSDLTLICENCHNEFVFSAGEQTFYASKNVPAPKLCPICRSLKAQEYKIPPKPTSSPIESAPRPPEALAKEGLLQVR